MLQTVPGKYLVNSPPGRIFPPVIPQWRDGPTSSRRDGSRIAQAEVRKSGLSPGFSVRHRPPRPGGPGELWVYSQRQDSVMSHTYSSALFHCVFSTKERRKLIPSDIQPRLWAYMGGVARKREMKALGVGGTDDHAHLLLSLPSSLPIAKAMREIKSESSRWMQEECGFAGFEWQEGYGAFSIGWTQVEATLKYIARQQEHHRRRDFQAEFVAFLKKHQIEYDPRYVWG